MTIAPLGLEGVALYPRCFISARSYQDWEKQRSKSRENASPCSDCNADFKAEKKASGNCQESVVKKQFLIRRKSAQKAVALCK